MNDFEKSLIKYFAEFDKAATVEKVEPFTKGSVLVDVRYATGLEMRIEVSYYENSDGTTTYKPRRSWLI